MGRFERNGLAFNYEEMGDPETPPVVLLHGFGGEARSWYPVMRGLAGDYHVIAPDLRGHGRSSAPAAVEDYSIELYAEDLAALLDHCEAGLVALVGSDLGGMMALQFATTWPEKVAALCVSDSSPAASDGRYAPEFAEHEECIAQLEQLVRERGTAALAKRRAREVRDAKLAAALRAQVGGIRTEGWLGAAHARRTRPDLTGRLRERLTMPVLLCVGAEDPARSAFDVMCEEMPGARSVVFEGTGHGVPVLRPEDFLKVLGTFLADVEQGRSVPGRRTVKPQS